jgi:hypothetical protein
MAAGCSSSRNNAQAEVINNSGFRDEACTHCAKLEVELEKIRLELKSTQKIIELLQEDTRLNMSVRSNVNHLYREEHSMLREDNKGWTTVGPKNHKTKRSPQQYKIPLLVNRFVMRTGNTTKYEGTPIKTGRAKKLTHRILLLGDSQARGCSELLQLNLNSEFGVSGIIKPGAKSSDILDTDSVKVMSQEDAVVVYAGNNDISKNSAREGLRNIINFVKRSSHTNISYRSTAQTRFS